MKKILLPLLFILIALYPVRSSDISGFWKSMDASNHSPTAIVGMYEFNGKMFGRLIITFNDGSIRDTIYNRNERAPNVVGNPYFAGLDFIWDLEAKGEKWANGRILDPQEGKIYYADIWLEGETLVLRGKIKIGVISLGRNQNWLPVGPEDLPPGFILPDLRHAIPRYYQPAE